MYHRVTDADLDPWSLCVTPQHFAQHLEVLRKHTHPLPLRELISELPRGNRSRSAVAVTFDDGYADNLLNAKPQLEHFNIPATVFVTTGPLGGQREFWWDELESLLLTPGTLPPSLRLGINGETHEWQLGDAACYPEAHWRRDRHWKAPGNPPTPRHELFLALWRLLQPVADSKQRNVLNTLRAWAGARPGARPSHRPISVPELGALADGELIEIGAHTVTHPILKGCQSRFNKGRSKPAGPDWRS